METHLPFTRPSTGTIKLLIQQKQVFDTTVTANGVPPSNSFSWYNSEIKLG